jgi:hypothetical protein
MNKQEQLAEQIAKAEELLYKHVAGDTGLFNNEVYCNFDKAAAAIVEAMELPATDSNEAEGPIDILIRHVQTRFPHLTKEYIINHNIGIQEGGLIKACYNAMMEYAQQFRTPAPAKEVEAANTQIVEWDSLRGMFNKVATSEHVIGYLEQNGYYLVKKLAKEVEAISDSPSNSIERVLEALDARQQYESEYQLTIPYDIGFHTGTAYAYGEAIELINRLMLHNEQNDERIATQQTMPQGTDAGIKEAAKEAISVPAQQPSLEEKKEDLVSDNNSSSVPCVTPLYINNSNQQ